MRLRVPRQLFLVRRGRFLGPRERMRLRVHRLVTGNLLFVGDGAIAVLIAIVVRVATLPVAGVMDILGAPLLRLIDRSAGRDTWWVVEVRFNDWDAEQVRVTEATDRADVEHRRREIRDEARRRGRTSP